MRKLFVFRLLLPVLSFVTDHAHAAHQYIYLSAFLSFNFQFFSSKFGNNSTECNIT